MLDCYYMNVSCDCSKEQSLALYEGLSRDRRERVDRLKDKGAAHKQIIIGAFLQHCLSGYIGVMPSQIKFEYNEQGKPYVPSDVHFNMSHSGDYAVLAVSDHPVGIDIERLRHKRLSVAKRFFCREEYEDIINAGGEKEQDRRFLEYWTVKEAYVKYLGKGLSIPLDSFRILMSDSGANKKEICVQINVNSQVPCEKGTDDNKVCISAFYLNEDYNIAICSEKQAMPCEKDIAFNSSNVKNICLSDIM
ncbi:MAG: 4'-phosphopantetheinyl transferase superfamily protein [Lachnospiraceae bacterium]|nr:4'-phosphopantetheinyl transferase superfamily protein [Lachnospiraceae bacterium]